MTGEPENGTAMPARRRKGCSPWALMGCGCGLLAMIGIFMVFLTLNLISLRERVDPLWNQQAYADCQRHCQYLANALESYRIDHDHLPATLDELKPHYLDTGTRLACPLQQRGLGQPYQYTPAGNAPEDAILTCRNHGQGTISVLRNGKVRIVTHSLRRSRARNGK